MACALMQEDADRATPAHDVDGFLRANSRAYVFAAAGDGSVRGWPMTAFYRTGLLFFTTYGKSAKVAHLRAGPTATVVVASPEGVEPVTWCEVSGAVRVIDFTHDVVDRFMAVGPLAASPDAGKDVSADVRERYRNRIANGKRVLIEVDVANACLGLMEGSDTL